MKVLTAIALVILSITTSQMPIKSEDKPKLTETVMLEGYLSAYNYNPTVGTIAYRHGTGEIPQDLSDYHGVIAVKDCSLVGKEAKLTYLHKVFNVIIFDCASRGNDGTRAWMDQNQIVAEIGYFMTEKYPYLVHSFATLEYENGG